MPSFTAEKFEKFAELYKCTILTLIAVIVAGIWLNMPKALPVHPRVVETVGPMPVEVEGVGLLMRPKPVEVENSLPIEVSTARRVENCFPENDQPEPKEP